MDWKKILKMDGFKVFVILMLLLFPYIGTVAHSSTVDGETSFTGRNALLGLPFKYIYFKYEFDNSASMYIPTFWSSYLNFVFDIIIGYLIAVIIAIGYYRFKKK
jgi:hypothetical protein